MQFKKQNNMPVFTTSVMLSSIVGYIAANLKDNKSIKDLFNDFASATIDELIRPIFLNDDEPTPAIKKLQEKPDSEAKQNAVKAEIISQLEDNPKMEPAIKELYDLIAKKQSTTITKHNTMSHVGDGAILSQDINDSTITITVHKSDDKKDA